MSLSVEQKFKALALVTKPASVLSFLGSFYIVQHILRHPKYRSKLQYQILLGLSACDLINSISSFLSTWPIPVGAPMIYGAAGNEKTCSIHGWFMQFSISSALYNGSLSLYYLLAIGYGWKERHFKYIKLLMHLVPIIFGVATATYGAVINGYHNAVFWCWFANPLKNYGIYRMALYYGPTWFAISLALFSMAMLTKIFFRQEKANLRYNQDGEIRNNYKRTKQVGVQGLLYSIVFIHTWIYSTIFRIRQFINPQYMNLNMLIMAACFLSMQGFSNFIVYIRPTVLKFCTQKYKEWKGKSKKKKPVSGLDPITQATTTEFALGNDTNRKGSQTFVDEIISKNNDNHNCVDKNSDTNKYEQV